MKDTAMATTATLSGAEFDELPFEEGRRWELLCGEMISVSSPTPRHQMILQRLLLALAEHLRSNPVQGIVLTDVEFALNSETRVRPDVLILGSIRAGSIDVDKVPIAGSPDLAIEIISPTERALDTQQKLEAYLRAGTREVWQVYPKSQSVVLYRDGSSVILGSDQTLCTLLLPGFSLAVGLLF
jgi:Uma2 family endonuclease